MSENTTLLQKSFPNGGFDDETWVSVLQAVEESYVQSIQYQIEIESKNEALDQANQFISDVVSSMSDILIVTNESLQVTKVNRSFLSMTGFAEEDVLGRSVETFLSTESKQLQTSLQEPVDYEDVHVTLQGAYSKILLTIACSCSYSATSLFKGRVIVGRPESEVFQAYAALQEAYKDLALTKQKMIQSEHMASLGRLVSGVAHELNTPISVLQGNLWSLEQLTKKIQPRLMNSHLVDASFQEIMEDCPILLKDSQGATHQIAQIVKSLKTFSEQEKSPQHLFYIKPCMEIAIEWVMGNVASDHVEVMLQVDDNIKIKGNESKFQQVMVNLVQNALDAVENTDSPKIMVSAKQDKGSVVLLIEDNGTGIPHELIHKIFDHFFSTKDVGKGTGLGLSISYELLQEMNATITAWNRIEGGTAFQIEFLKSMV